MFNLATYHELPLPGLAADHMRNVFRVEYPVGVGFSIGESRATSEEVIAEEFNKFFLNFQKIFGISNFKIYVTGESYAGRYVPYIASGMLDKNDTTHFNVSGRHCHSSHSSIY